MIQVQSYVFTKIHMCLWKTKWSVIKRSSSFDWTVYLLCWLLSFDWIEWHDLCRKNDRIVWTLDQQPFNLICSIAKALHSSNNIISLHWSLLWMFSAPNYATSENWVPNNVPESCKMLRRLSSTILNALKFETIWSISSLTKLVNYVSLPFSKNIHFAVAALLLSTLFHIFAFAAKVFVTWRFLVE